MAHRRVGKGNMGLGLVGKDRVGKCRLRVGLR